MLGIDLGSTCLRVARAGSGIVFQEACQVALESNTGRVLAVGNDAQVLPTSGTTLVRVVRGGALADPDAAFALLQKAFRQVRGPFPGKPRVQAAIPSRSTPVERRALKDVLLRAGAREVKLIPAPLAAARGAGLDTARPFGRMVVDVGGGKLDVALISMDAVLASRTLRTGSELLDDTILRQVRQAHGVLIGPRAAEELKIHLATCLVEGSRHMEISGLGLVDGAPRSVVVEQADIASALRPHLQGWLACIVQVLQAAPPEISADIYKEGLLLSGAGSQLQGLADFLEAMLALPVRMAPRPADGVALGLLV